MNIDIVLLNGPSSSGKSSIAREFQKKLNAKGFDSIIINSDQTSPAESAELIFEKYFKGNTNE
ncbi:MAG: adenylyl-sulfate kinase [Candidatus Riflebacteria bacterium]|nr:adenylyl-sulfate kinase [Candidatus Riflebacteria bacterium]